MTTTPNCPTCKAPILAVAAEVDPRSAQHHHTAQCGHRLTHAQARHLWDAGMRWTVPVIDGASLVTAERGRQVHEEGFTPEHDASHGRGDLPWAAWCYLDRAVHEHTGSGEPPSVWPWEAEAWKEHPPLRALIIAGALIAAEIDRRLLAERANPEEK